jgi:hypothetical protein
MKKVLLGLLLMQATVLMAATKPNPADYTVTAHVVASHSGGQIQLIYAMIDGQEVELQGNSLGVLALGDYSARLLKTDHSPNTYDMYLTYEFLFPDGHTRPYLLIGFGPGDGVAAPTVSHP